MLVIVAALALWVAGPVAVPAPPGQQASALDTLFAGRHPGEITDRLKTGEGDIELPDPTNPGAMAFGPGPLGRLTNMVCRSDLVAVGTFVSVETRITSDASSLYSEWQFEMSDPLKRQVLPPSVESLVTVFMRGGSKQFGTRTVRVANRSFATGLEPGAEFLLFSRWIADMGVLIATDGFRLDGDRVTGASRRPLHPELDAMPRTELLATVRTVRDRTADNADCVRHP